MSASSSKSSVTATLRWEIVIVLAVIFGMSGLRATLRLVEALVPPTPLKGQTAQLNPSQAPAVWLDVSLQVLSAGTLVAWGSLAVYMLWVHPVTTNPLRFLQWSGLSDVWHGLAAATAIGLPGLCFYGVARAWGLSATVDPAAGVRAWWSYVLLVISACATAWAEEVVVVGWLQTRLAQCGVSRAPRVVASALLRGLYHVYQGPSAGVGNAIMGLVFGTYFERTGRVWPLVIAHAVIDCVAFVGAALLAGHLPQLGL